MIKRNAIVFAFALLVILLMGCGNSETQQVKEKDKNLAPMFVLNDVDGNSVALEELRGEKVYLKYWASWCSACLSGLEELNELADEDVDFKVLSIVSPNYNSEMDEDEFVEWFTSLEYDDLNVLLDTKGKWAKEYGILAYPSSYYIDSNGVLVKNIAGHNSNEMIKDQMANIQ